MAKLDAPRNLTKSPEAARFYKSAPPTSSSWIPVGERIRRWRKRWRQRASSLMMLRVCSIAAGAARKPNVMPLIALLGILNKQIGKSFESFDRTVWSAWASGIIIRHSCSYAQGNCFRQSISLGRKSSSPRSNASFEMVRPPNRSQPSLTVTCTARSE